jgi:hypothetical protein
LIMHLAASSLELETDLSLQRDALAFSVMDS